MMDFVKWMTSIQGKDISTDILSDIKSEVFSTLGDSISGIPRKVLVETVKSICKTKDYTVDVNYVIDNVTGLHIDPLDLYTEHTILTDMEYIYSTIGYPMKHIPHIYILQKISDRHNLGIKKTIEFPRQKTTAFDKVLENIGF